MKESKSLSMSMDLEKHGKTGKERGLKV